MSMNRDCESSKTAMGFGDGEIARRKAGKVSVREGAVRLRFELPEVGAREGVGLRVVFVSSVMARPEVAERQLLAETFLVEKEACKGTDVVRSFMGRLAEEARAVIGRKEAEYWMMEEGKAELSEALRKAADAAGFATGLEVVAPYEAEVRSPELERIKAEHAARERAERDQEERLAKLRRAGEVLKEFEKIRAGSPEITVSEVVARMGAGDQPGLVRELMISGRNNSAGDVYVVAGPCLARIGAERLEVEEITVPGEAGPFRSVQWVDMDGEKRLILGARGGLVVMDPMRPNEARVYLMAEAASSALGFNRVVYWEEKWWGTHSELGLVGWDVGVHDRPAARIGRERMTGATAADGPRQLVRAGGKLVFSVGERVFGMDESMIPTPGAGESGTRDSIVAVLQSMGGLMVVRGSGMVEMLDEQTLAVVRREQRAGRVTAATLLPFYDLPRVLLGTEDGPILGISMADSVVTQFASNYRGLRTLAASSGWIAGISADRQRLVILGVGECEPANEVREVHLAGRLKHRVGDIAMV